MDVWKNKKISIGLVHPMARKIKPEEPITKDMLRQMYDSKDIMCCQPYVVAGCMLDVPVYE